MSFDDPGFENQVAQSLRDTGEELSPRDLTRLVNGGVADGRKRRRRRNAAVVGGSAALALVAVGGAMVPSLLNTSHTVAGPAAQPKMANTASATAASVSDAQRQQQMIDTLKSLLPSGGKITEATGRWAMPGNMGLAPLASLVYNEGPGASLIEVGLAHNPKPQAGEQQPGCGNPVYEPGDVCHLYTLPGGAKLLVDQGYEYPSRGSGTKDWHALLMNADGTQVDVQEWNSSAEKGASVSRSTPPLSAEQLKALATSTKWKPLLAALPAPKPTAKTGGQSGPDAGAILKTLNNLLPQGVHGRNSDGQTGYAEEQLGDGKAGVGLIGINVEQFDPKDSATIAQLYSGGTTLPDGSRLAIHQTGAEKGGSGAVQWVVDLMRPNGERIVAQEFNAPRQGVAADRALPVLTIDQLKAIVTNAAWAKLV